MDANLTSHERRKAERQPVRRRALFSGEDGALRVGEVVDTSAGGLRIVTDTPAPSGTELNVEIHSASGDWLGSLRLRARVVYASGDGTGTTMGVRILPDRMRPHPALPRPNIPQRTPREWTPVPRKVTTAPASAQKRLWPWLVPPAALALLLFLFLFRLQALSMTGFGSGIDVPDHSVAALTPHPAQATTPTEDPASESSMRTPADLATSSSNASGLLRPIRPVPPMRLEDFESVEGTLGSVRYASTNAASGTEAVTPADGMPWIYAQSSDQGAQAALVSEKEWQARPDAPKDQSTPEEVLIVVEKSAHRLVLYRNGEVLRTFDVGLGRNNSTPEGDYRIAVKATNPAWKHKGRIIPGGSPENRIGKRWMALGKDKTVTSYGIHPAKNTRAIGGNTSFGCIQMYPDDADTLFRFCPIGTRVNIRV